MTETESNRSELPGTAQPPAEKWQPPLVTMAAIGGVLALVSVGGFASSASRSGDTVVGFLIGLAAGAIAGPLLLGALLASLSFAGRDVVAPYKQRKTWTISLGLLVQVLLIVFTLGAWGPGIPIIGAPMFLVMAGVTGVLCWRNAPRKAWRYVTTAMVCAIVIRTVFAYAQVFEYWNTYSQNLASGFAFLAPFVLAFYFLIYAIIALSYSVTHGKSRMPIPPAPMVRP